MCGKNYCGKIGVNYESRITNSALFKESRSIFAGTCIGKKISELGGNVEIINYCPIYFLDPMDPLKQRQWSLKEKLKAIINGHAQRERYRLFQNFNKKYLPRMTMRYNTPNDLETAELDYDVYICGSDQIWNPENVKHDIKFFL